MNTSVKIVPRFTYFLCVQSVSLSENKCRVSREWQHAIVGIYGKCFIKGHSPYFLVTELTDACTLTSPSTRSVSHGFFPHRRRAESRSDYASHVDVARVIIIRRHCSRIRTLYYMRQLRHLSYHYHAKPILNYR